MSFELPSNLPWHSTAAAAEAYVTLPLFYHPWGWQRTREEGLGQRQHFCTRSCWRHALAPSRQQTLRPCFLPCASKTCQQRSAPLLRGLASISLHYTAWRVLHFLEGTNLLIALPAARRVHSALLKLRSMAFYLPWAGNVAAWSVVAVALARPQKALGRAGRSATRLCHAKCCALLGGAKARRLRRGRVTLRATCTSAPHPRCRGIGMAHHFFSASAPRAARDGSLALPIRAALTAACDRPRHLLPQTLRWFLGTTRRAAGSDAPRGAGTRKRAWQQRRRRISRRFPALPPPCRCARASADIALAAPAAWLGCASAPSRMPLRAAAAAGGAILAR